MTSKWQEYSLEQLGEIITGKTPSSSIGDAFNGDTPFITPKDMDGRKWIGKTERCLSKIGVKAVESSIIPPNSVAVSCIGSDMGKVAMVKHYSITNQQINTIIVDTNQFNPEYIYYNLSIKQNDLKAIAGGSATPILNKGHFSKFRIVLPSKTIQDQIVEFVSPIDNKIQLNHQIDQTLGEIAQTIFKSWFVDFDPVKAKVAAKENGQDPERAAMCAISGKTVEELEQITPEQLNQLARTANLFPDEFVSLGPFTAPNGWKYQSFAKLALLKTTSIKPYEEPNKLWEHYSIPAFDEGKFPAYEMGAEIKSNKYKVFPSSILSSKLNPRFPRTWLPILENKDSAICSTEFMQFVPLNKAYRAFVYNLILSKRFQEGIAQRVTGSTGSRQRAQPKAVQEMDVIIPSHDLIAEYCSKVDQLNSLILINIRQNKILEKLRTALLPKLLTGDITV